MPSLGNRSITATTPQKRILTSPREFPDLGAEHGSEFRARFLREPRRSRESDEVIDFDRVLRDPNSPMRILTVHDSGDHGCPNDAGYQAMAQAIHPKLFKNGESQYVARVPSLGSRQVNFFGSTIPLARGVSAFLLSAAAGAALTLTPACETANRQAQAFLAEEQLEEAKALLLQTTAQLGNSPDDKLCRGLTLGNLANVRIRLGELSRAKEAAEASVSQLEEMLGTDATALRHPLKLLANIAIQNEEFGKGFQLLSRAEKLPPASHSNLATIKGLRAILMMREGKEVDAEKEYRSAIRERELAGEQETPVATPELWNLGVLYLTERRTAEAIPLLERCLRISDNFPLNAELKVKTFLALGLAQARLGNNQRAGNCFRRAIDLIDGLPPVLRSDLGRILYSQYAQFLRGVSQKKEAREIAKKGESLYGKDTPHLTVSVYSLLTKSRQP